MWRGLELKRGRLIDLLSSLFRRSISPSCSSLCSGATSILLRHSFVSPHDHLRALCASYDPTTPQLALPSLTHKCNNYHLCHHSISVTSSLLCVSSLAHPPHTHAANEDTHCLLIFLVSMYCINITSRLSISRLLPSASRPHVHLSNLSFRIHLHITITNACLFTAHCFTFSSASLPIHFHSLLLQLSLFLFSAPGGWTLP